MKRILVLADAITPWHSVWIRFGQYIPYLPYEVDVCCGIKQNGNGQLLPPGVATQAPNQQRRCRGLLRMVAMRAVRPSGCTSAHAGATGR